MNTQYFTNHEAFRDYMNERFGVSGWTYEPLRGGDGAEEFCIYQSGTSITLGSGYRVIHGPVDWQETPEKPYESVDSLDWCPHCYVDNTINVARGDANVYWCPNGHVTIHDPHAAGSQLVYTFAGEDL